ncbi:MAG: hypothetical protein ACYDIC_17240 [Desulfobaccales bacterium]
MNAERLHAIAIVLHQEMSENNTLSKLKELVDSLQNLVNQGHTSNQQSLANNLNAMYASLTDKPSDRFSPAWRQLLAEIGGEDLFGSSMKSKIEDIFSRNQITPAVALEELKGFYQRLQSFDLALNNLLSSFRQFAIGNEKLSPGNCEIGILVPRKAVDNRLIPFADELKKLSFILNTLSEVATGKKDNLSIKTISSTDLTVYLDAIPAFAACLAVAVERIVALYKQLLEIRKLRAELQKQGVPDGQTAGIEEHANSLMKNGTENLAAEIVEKFYTNIDAGRKNELINATKIALNSIANRIDQGYNIDVRVEPIEKGKQQEDANKKIVENINLIQAASENMQFMKLEGDPILRLPEVEEESKRKK